MRWAAARIAEAGTYAGDTGNTGDTSGGVVAATVSFAVRGLASCLGWELPLSLLRLPPSSPRGKG